MLESFLLAMRRLASTVNIVTCEESGTPFGIAATAVTSLSTNPESLLICINRGSSICDVIERRGQFCVNLLAEHHEKVSRIFGGAIRGPDRFLHGDWAREGGLPWLVDAQANVFCDVSGTVPYASHMVFFGRVTRVLLSGEPRPLIYGDGRYLKVV